MDGRRLAERIESLCRAADHRSPDSHIAGGIALAERSGRRSKDIDIFHDDAARVAEAAKADAVALTNAGFQVDWATAPGQAICRAIIRRGADSTLIEWVADADFRYYPATQDDLFGYVLHPVDLAINKVVAAAGRREARDMVDLIVIHEQILPLGAAIAAAVGRFPGPSPEELLAEISRRSWLTPTDLAALSMETPVDPSDIHRRIRAMLDSADAFLRRLPSDSVGFVFLKDGKPVQPDPGLIGECTRHAPSRRGSWPSSPEIGHAMLERLIEKPRRT
jgi:hypothetical protein